MNIFLSISVILYATQVFLCDGFVKQGPNIMLEYIGDTEGKSFYMETTTLRNWFDARDFCQFLGMQQATITSSKQAGLLKHVANTTEEFTSCEWFWTAGKDSERLGQMRWDTNGNTPDAYVDASFAGSKVFPPQSCLLYKASPDTRESVYYIQLCTELAGTLCAV